LDSIFPDLDSTPLVYRAFGGESSNGRLGDSAQKHNKTGESIWLAPAEKGRIPLSFGQRLPQLQVRA